MRKKIQNFLYYLLGKQKIIFKGINNLFICPNSVTKKRLKINVYGNNNKIIVGENAYLNNIKIIVGFPDCPIENCLIKIGSNSGMNSAAIQLAESNSLVEIGENCMVSFDVELNCTDTHAILDDNNNLLNQGKSIVIGDHVWLCKETRIMKNTNIPSGCIVAQGSIVTKKFEKENCVIAGNPSKVVKENVHWDNKRPEFFLKNDKDRIQNGK